MNLFFSIFLLFSNTPELIIGKKVVDPGIVFIFEGAIKDEIHPKSLHLAEDEANVHLEARVNWDIENIPKGVMGLDIGNETLKLFESTLSSSKTILWNGPMGVF